MAGFITEISRDGRGNEVLMRFWVDDEGNRYPVQRSVDADGSIPGTLRGPVTGRHTVTADAAEVFAGASRLAGRRKLVITNHDPSVAILIGASGLTRSNGFRIEPGATATFDLDPSVAVPVFAISESGHVTTSVMEY